MAAVKNANSWPVTPVGHLAFDVFQTKFGFCLFAINQHGLFAVSLGETEAELTEEFLASKKLKVGRVAPQRDSVLLAPYQRVFQAYLAGEPWPTECVLDLAGTPFQLQVWNALLRIPFGQTLTYGQLAQRIGKPSAVRAVANACGANPLAVVVPCHRVVATDGKLTGYRWGVDRKQKLLANELACRG